MSIPERYKYPFDKTGTSPNNLVYPEKRTLTKQIRTIVPKEGTYFTQSLIVTFNGKSLVRGVDYKPTFLAEKATVRTNKEVCGGIHFINDKIIGDVLLSYRVVGGEFGEYAEANRALIDVLDGNNGAIRWDQIIELPEAFVPTRHVHHVDDIIGTTPFVLELQGIRRAIENLRSYRNVAIYRLIGSIHTRVNNFIESYNNADSYVRDTLEDLKQRVGQEKLVTEPVFNLAKRALDKRIDAYENGLDEFRTQQNEKNRQFTQQIEGIAARQNELQQNQDTLKNRIDNLTISAVYGGSQKNGQFITVSRNGDAWTITQTDPSWLVPTLNRISTQEGKTKQLETDMRNAEGRIRTIEEELPFFRNYQMLIRANQERIETVNRTLSTRISDAVTEYNDQHRQLQAKVDNNKAETDKKIEDVENSIVPSIRTFTDPLAAKDILHDEAIFDIRDKANDLTSKVNDYIRDNNLRVANAEKAHADFKKKQEAFNESINQMLLSVDVTLTYLGGRDGGNFISLEKEGKVFNFTYNDPGWLVPLEKRIGGLETLTNATIDRVTTNEGKLRAHETHLTEHDKYEGKIQALRNDFTETKDEHKKLLSGLRDDLDTSKNDFNSRIERLVEEDKVNKRRLDQLETQTTGLDVNTRYVGRVGVENFISVERQGNVFTLVVKDPAGFTNTIEKVTRLEERATATEGKVEGLESKTDTTNAQLTADKAELKSDIQNLSEALKEKDKALEKSIADLAAKESAFEDEINPRVSALENGLTAHASEISSLKQKLNKNTVEGQYVGRESEGGQFVTVVEKEEGGYIVKQDDPSWLATLRDNITTLQSAGGNQAERISNLEKGVTRLTSESDDQDDRLRNQLAKINALQEADKTQIKNHEALEAKVNDFKSTAETHLDQGDRERLALAGRIGPLEEWKNQFNLRANYTGERKNGTYITVSGTEDKQTWTINYADPAWLAPLSDKVTSQGKQLEALQGASGNQNEKQTQLENALEALTNRTGTLESNVNSLKKKDDDLESKLTAEVTRARGAEEALGQRIDELTARHETLANGIDNRIQNGFNQLHAPFAKRINDTEVKARAADKRMDGLEGTINSVNTARGEEIAGLRNSINDLSGGTSQRTEALERRVTQLEKDRDTTNKNLNDFKANQEELHRNLDANLETTRQAINGITAVNETQSDEIAKLKAAKDTQATQLQALTGKIDKAATKEELKASDAKNAGLVQTAKDELNASINAVKTELTGASADKERELKAYADKVAGIAKQEANQKLSGVEGTLNELKTKAEKAISDTAGLTDDLREWKAKSPERLNKQHTSVTVPAIETAVDELRQEVQAREEEEKQKTNKYRETMNEILEFLQNYFVRADGPYLKTNMPKLELMPVNTVNLENNEKDEEEYEPYMKRTIQKEAVYPKILYPYSQFQPIEIGVEVRVMSQSAKLTFGYLGFKERDPHGTILTETNARIVKNKTFELVSVQRDDTGFSVDFGGTEVPREGGIIIYPKSGLDFDNPESYQMFDYNDLTSARGKRGLQHLYTREHVLKVQPNTSYVASQVLGESAGNVSPLTTDNNEYGYTNGQWRRLSMRIDGGWWMSETGEQRLSKMPFAGTKFIVPAIESGQLNEIEFRNFYVRPVDEKVTLDNLPGIENYLDKWLKKKVVEQASLPPDSRWDISRFRIQPGAENFSSVGVDEHDNLEVRGVVYYDTVGKGKRGVFAPTTEIAVTTSKNWKVPDEYEGRVALITVRAASRSEVGKVTHSCVRQVMVTLTGGTEVPIQVGDISSFGTHVTVSNAIDYPDAIVGRIESPAGSRVNPGLVSIKV